MSKRENCNPTEPRPLDTTSFCSISSLCLPNWEMPHGQQSPSSLTRFSDIGQRDATLELQIPLGEQLSLLFTTMTSAAKAKSTHLSSVHVSLRTIPLRSQCWTPWQSACKSILENSIYSKQLSNKWEFWKVEEKTTPIAVSLLNLAQLKSKRQKTWCIFFIIALKGLGSQIYKLCSIKPEENKI